MSWEDLKPGSLSLPSVDMLNSNTDKVSSRKLSKEEGIFHINSANLTDVSDICEDIQIEESNWILSAYICGVVYMFVAIAIVCDDFFVPALEVMASESYLNLSMDVAGATLMAAGGSAPELFTALIGTFSETEVGFGTIVGSAVFNVLFVIAMCAVLSKEVLSLTWWPLLRDCSYYSIGLVTLAIFCGFLSPGEIELWEAAIQFSLYIGYVLVMKYNTKIHRWVMENVLRKKISGNDSELNTKDDQDRKNSLTFRVGLLKFFMGKYTATEKVGIAIISKSTGKIEAIFKSFDKSGDGFIDMQELKCLCEQLDTPLSEADLQKFLDEIDLNHDGKVDLSEFTKFYITSEMRIKAEIRATFHAYDFDASGTIDRGEMKQLLNALGYDHNINTAVTEAFDEAYMKGPHDQLSLDEFESWYLQSPLWSEMRSKANMAAEEVDESLCDNLKIPSDQGLFAIIRWIFLLPIIATLCFTIPDVQRKGNEKYCGLAFACSIFWIGVFTYCMVEWAQIVGNSLGIPIVIMGLTFIAAGTSVPDLISSVIVARMGEGDMAISSSIGSNIFDITVGLPVPWMLYCLWPNSRDIVQIKTEGMATSIIILLVMLIIIIVLIHFHGW
eukprot:CAMPEP_0194386600 /NCGR_PEP_ID=MMETSP0174-20130528/87393_1 /TAXON_ID=216777 /ORGANISM="Proboscia alata, Strain PI-D3" /LENGTH=612 /DNA_ID=CAMNT_0039175973 /DNA_START=433 /DNA_END=2268 /DNA_ORIENTATION=+